MTTHIAIRDLGDDVEQIVASGTLEECNAYIAAFNAVIGHDAKFVVMCVADYLDAGLAATAISKGWQDYRGVVDKSGNLTVSTSGSFKELAEVKRFSSVGQQLYMHVFATAPSSPAFAAYLRYLYEQVIADRWWPTRDDMDFVPRENEPNITDIRHGAQLQAFVDSLPTFDAFYLDYRKAKGL